MSDLIPKTIMKYFHENPKIGRLELQRKAGISDFDARFYCRVFKTRQANVKIKDVGIAAYDIHHPYHSEECISCLFQVIKDINPTIFIMAGDNMDMDTISAYNIKKPKLVEDKRISKDYEGFEKDILTPLNNILLEKCKKFFLMGNHEERVERLIESQPKLEGLVEPIKHLNLNGWTVKDYKEVLQIDHMCFAHGIYYNKYHTEKNVRIYQKNIFTGHAHTSQVYTSVSPVDSMPKQGVSVGCLCNRNPHYAEDKPNHWVNQFLLFYLLTDGTFRYELITIIFGRCVVNGKLYDGNEKKMDEM